MKLAGARVLVVGLAKSGLAALELLLEQGALPVASDQKALDELPEARARLVEWGVPFIPQAEVPFQEAQWIVLSPGVPVDLPEIEAARRRGVAVTGELELAAPYLQGDCIGITGANGKTTTTALVGHILARCGVPAQVGGNIGTPPAALVRSSRQGQWNVLELSSFQLETIRTFRARIAAALNVTPDHLDRHHTFEAYAAAKARLFETQRAGDYAILNADDPACRGYASRTAAEVLWFSQLRPVARGAHLEGAAILLDGRPWLETAAIPLRGRHNLENVMAAALASRLAGAPPEGIAQAIREFPGVEHRLERVLEAGGVAWYNDSKATNVDATLKAIEAFDGGLWIILGGKDKGSDYRPLRQPLAARARAALLIGAASGKIASQLEGALPLVECGTLEAAVDKARRLAVPGETVLLAPACASFDQFQNYEHRGRVFKDLVRQLGAGAAPSGRGEESGE